MSIEDNENLAQKIINAFQKTKSDLNPFLETYAISSKKDATEEEISKIIGNDNLVEFYIEQVDESEVTALKVNLNSNKINQKLKTDTKQLFGDAVTSALSNLKVTKSSIEKENYAEALERIIKANKVIGCLEALKKLGLLKKLLTAESSKRAAAAYAKSPLLIKAKNIILSIAEKQTSSFRSQSELFDSIIDACHSEIKKQLGEDAITWEEFNFTRNFTSHAMNDKEFGEKINSLIRRKNVSSNLLSQAWSGKSVEGG